MQCCRVAARVLDTLPTWDDLLTYGLDLGYVALPLSRWRTPKAENAPLPCLWMGAGICSFREAVFRRSFRFSQLCCGSKGLPSSLFRPSHKERGSRKISSTLYLLIPLCSASGICDSGQIRAQDLSLTGRSIARLYLQIQLGTEPITSVHLCLHELVRCWTRA